jgi:mitochondrial fission protein ELM1
MLAGVTAWLLTDGKVGDEAQCIAVAEALGLEAEARHVKPRLLFYWAMPFGPIDPREAPERPRSPIRAPFPDVVIASGRRATAYVRRVKRASLGRTFTVILKDPRTGAKAADFIWVPEHDRLRGPNVLATLTSPHRLSPQKLAGARAAPPPHLAALPRPRAAVLVGGDSRHHRFTAADTAAFLSRLAELAESGTSLMVTTSRRTPAHLAEGIGRLMAGRAGFLWNGQGDNPLLPMLALADAVVATADSTNMVGEAAATGAPVLVFEPSGGNPRISRFLRSLGDAGIVHPFTGRLAGSAYQPLDSTSTIAEAIERAFRAHNQASA